MSDQPSSPDASDTGELRDALPADLNAAEFVGVYRFPDNSRRRIPGYLYLGLALLLLVVWIMRRGDAPVLVNGGYVFAAVVLGFTGLMCLTSGWRMTVDEKEALVLASQTIGFPVGHASAQQVWRGVRSRPTWRVLCYSTENPPRRRGFVQVDAVDGRVLEHMSEENPETDWQEPD